MARRTRHAIPRAAAAELADMVEAGRLALKWTQEDLADGLSAELDKDCSRHDAQRLESASRYPLSSRKGQIPAVDLWRAACTILGLDTARVNRLQGGV